MYQKELKQKAKKFRRTGFTHREIAKKFHIALSTAHEWTKGITLTDQQKKEIQKRWYKNYIQRFRAYIKQNPENFHKEILKRLRPYQYKKRYSKNDLIQIIKKFYRANKRIPLKREIGETRVYRQNFGTWNNAIRSAGFDPNPVRFAKKFIANDGHHCDSFTEKVIDD